MNDATKMTLSNGEMTKGEVHWIITYDEAKDVHYVECPVTPMELTDSGDIVSGKSWHLSVLTEGTFMHCIEWIRGIAKFDDPNYGPDDDFVEVERPGGNETRQEDEACG